MIFKKYKFLWEKNLLKELLVQPRVKKNIMPKNLKESQQEEQKKLTRKNKPFFQKK